MANTITLADSLSWATCFANFKPGNIGTANEPAVTSANVVIQTIIGPPFAWNWNRAVHSFITTEGIQDYKEQIVDFGFIEKASYIPAVKITNTSLTSNVATYTANNTFSAGDTVTVTGVSNGGGALNVTNAAILSATSTTFTVAITNADIASAVGSGIAASGNQTEITNVATVLGTGNEEGAPNNIAPQIDDNNGNMTFRLLPRPDKVYQINVVYQRRVDLMVDTSSKWTPIPDNYSYVYQNGFLALMLAYWNDARWTEFNKKFVGALLGAADGLDATQRDIFMRTWLSFITEQQNTGLKNQQGVNSRGQ